MASTSVSTASSRLVSAGQQCALYAQAVDQRLHRGPVQRAAVAGLGQGEQHVHTLFGAGRTASDVQAVRDERVLQLQHLLGQAHDTHVGIATSGGIPRRLGIGQIQAGGLRLQQRGHGSTLGGLRVHGAPALNRRLQVVQTLVEAGLSDRGCEVADERGA